MADSSAFTWLCDELEKATDLSRLEARGTVRLALKEGGLVAADLTPQQAGIVAEQLLPRELEARAVEGAESLCRRLATGVKSLRDQRSGASPDEVFGSLSRDPVGGANE